MDDAAEDVAAELVGAEQVERTPHVRSRRLQPREQVLLVRIERGGQRGGDGDEDEARQQDQRNGGAGGYVGAPYPHRATALMRGSTTP